MAVNPSLTVHKQTIQEDKNTLQLKSKLKEEKKSEIKFCKLKKMAETAMSLAKTMVDGVLQNLATTAADEVAKMLGVRQEVW